MPSFLIQPVITTVATEIIKWLVEVIGPEVPALAAKWVALAVSAILTWVTAAKIPIDLGPALQQYQPVVVTAITAALSYLVHDVATAVAQIAKVPPSATPKLTSK